MLVGWGLWWSDSFSFVLKWLAVVLSFDFFFFFSVQVLSNLVLMFRFQLGRHHLLTYQVNTQLEYEEKKSIVRW